MTFRFGVVAGTARTGAQRITTAQRAEQPEWVGRMVGG